MAAELKSDAQGVYELNTTPPSDDVVSVRHHGTDQDVMDMSRLGKKQQFQRNFRFLSMLGFSSTLLASWECVIAASASALVNGGLAGYVWSALITVVVFSTVVVSMADMASMAPTSGGQYHWVSEFAPKSKQRFLSYIAGWTSALGWQCGIASAAFLSASMIEGLLVLNFENYSTERWHTTLILIGICLVATFFNTFLAQHLPLLEGLILLLHVLGFFAIIIPLWVLAPRVSASTVFTHFSNSGGWMNSASAMCIGHLAILYCFLGPDCVAHMSEEIRDASRIVPRTMLATVALNGVLSFVAAITFAFCITDLEDALNSDTGYPFISVFYAATNSKGATSAMTSIFIVLLACAATACVATASRQVFAFARDEGLPFPGFFSKVSAIGVNIPLNAILVSLTITIIIGLINIGSTTAFNCIVSLQVAANLSTYGLAIGCVFFRRVRGLPLLPSRWSMGRLAIPMNVIALLYIVFAFILSFFPSSRVDLSVDSMNWAIVMYFGVLTICLTLYFVQGRHKYVGPVAYVRRLE